METFLEILKYTLPSVAILIAIWLLSKQFVAVIQSQIHQESRKIANNKTLVLRLQAYERLAVFLERISLDSLLIREQQSGQTARQFHSHLLHIIRQEFDHNLSQQIYLDEESWKVARMAKENTIKMLNASLSAVNPEGDSLSLSKQALDFQMEATSSPAQAALEFMKNQVRKIF